MKFNKFLNEQKRKESILAEQLIPLMESTGFITESASISTIEGESNEVFMERFMVAMLGENYQQKEHVAPLVEAANGATKFTANAEFRSDLAKYIDDEVVYSKFKEFIATKKDNLGARFGSNDTPFSGNNILRGYKHAKLTQDICVVYKAEGSTLSLFAIKTHKDLGDSNTSKPKLIKVNANKFDTQAQTAITV